MTTDAGSRRDPDRLADFLHERLGDRFRSLVEYRADDETVHYVRDDVDGAVARDRLARIQTLYEGERASALPTESDPDFGPLYASTHVFGGAMVIHLLDESGSAVGFSFDHSVGGRLSEFVGECLSVLYDGNLWDGHDGRDGVDTSPE
jgi:hypothetical protein